MNIRNALCILGIFFSRPRLQRIDAFVDVARVADILAEALLVDVFRRAFGVHIENEMQIRNGDTEVLMFEFKTKIKDVRLVKINVANALIDRVGKHVAIDQQHVRIGIIEAFERFKPIQSEPQRHALAVHGVCGDAVLCGEVASDHFAEERIVHGEGDLPDLQPAIPQRFGKTRHLHAFAGSVDALECNDLRHALPSRMRCMARIVFSLVANAVIRK